MTRCVIGWRRRGGHPVHLHNRATALGHAHKLNPVVRSHCASALVQLHYSRSRARARLARSTRYLSGRNLAIDNDSGRIDTTCLEPLRAEPRALLARLAPCRRVGKPPIMQDRCVLWAIQQCPGSVNCFHRSTFHFARHSVSNNDTVLP